MAVKMPISEFLILKVKDKDLIRYPKVQTWCTLPYPGYPKGCRNYDTRDSCPPRAKFLDEFARGPWTLVVAVCDIAEYTSLRRKEHEDWTEKQLRNPRHWQSNVRKRLRDKTEEIMQKIAGADYLEKPEAHGVHLFLTMSRLGYILLREPYDKVYFINLIYFPIGARQSKLPFA